MSPTPAPKTVKSSLVSKKTKKPCEFGIVVNISYDGELSAYFSDHELLREYRGFFKNERFLSKDTVSKMVKTVDDLKSDHDSNYRGFVKDGDEAYTASVLGDFMECVGRKAKNGDVVCTFVNIEIPC